MKISVNKNSFYNALQTVSIALPKLWTQAAIYNCILIDAEKNKISLYANNTEIVIFLDVEGNIIEKGKIAIEGTKLLEMVRKLPNDSEIIINVENNYNCNILGKNGLIEQKISGKNPDEFPKVNNFDDSKFISISEYALKKMVEKVSVAISRDPKETKRELKGISTSIQKDEIVMKSLDTYKYAETKQKLTSNYENMYALIPGNTLEEVAKLIKGDINKVVNIYFNDNKVVFKFANTTLISTIINAKFPETEQLKRTECNTQICIDRKELKESIERTNTFVNIVDEKPCILDIKDKEIQVRLQSVEGEIKEILEADKKGNDLIIAFNQKQIISLLDCIEDEKVNIYFTTSKQPAIIKDEKESYYYIILPSRI